MPFWENTAFIDIAYVIHKLNQMLYLELGKMYLPKWAVSGKKKWTCQTTCFSTSKINHFDLGCRWGGGARFMRDS